MNPGNAMVTSINRDLLRFAAGSAIFCPLCDRVLDAKTTVNITAGAVSKTICAPCWDSKLRPLLSPERIAQAEVLDGRVVFKRVRS